MMRGTASQILDGRGHRLEPIRPHQIDVRSFSRGLAGRLRQAAEEEGRGLAGDGGDARRLDRQPVEFTLKIDSAA